MGTNGITFIKKGGKYVAVDRVNKDGYPSWFGVKFLNEIKAAVDKHGLDGVKRLMANFRIICMGETPPSAGLIGDAYTVDSILEGGWAYESNYKEESYLMECIYTFDCDTGLITLGFPRTEERTEKRYYEKQPYNTESGSHIRIEESPEKLEEETVTVKVTVYDIPAPLERLDELIKSYENDGF